MLPVVTRELVPTLPLFLVVVGCFPQFGEYTGGGAGGAGGAGGGAGGQGGDEPPPACGVQRYCVEVPTGWDGPVALTLDGETCTGAYGEEVIAGQTEITAPSATCGCGCGPAAGATCSVSVQRYFDDACTNAFAASISLPPGHCATISAGAALSWQATSTATPGSCAPEEGVDVPQISSVSRSLCATEAPPNCAADGLCAARPEATFEPRICIYDEGDVDCPTSDYPERWLLFTEGVDDQRGCDVPCSCSESAATCGGFVTGFQGSSCGAAQDGAMVGVCSTPYVDSNQSLRYSAMGLDQGSCSPLPRTPIGTVTGLGPLTVCCTGTLPAG